MVLNLEIMITNFNFIKGAKNTKPINYVENLGSAQCKSAVMIAALKTLRTTKIKSLPSRNHTELMFKNVSFY